MVFLCNYVVINYQLINLLSIKYQLIYYVVFFACHGKSD